LKCWVLMRTHETPRESNPLLAVYRVMGRPSGLEVPVLLQ